MITIFLYRNEHRGGDWGLMVQWVSGRQRPHVPSHQVCSVLQNCLDGEKDANEDVCTLITNVHPYIFRALQSQPILSRICFSSQEQDSFNRIKPKKIKGMLINYLIALLSADVPGPVDCIVLVSFFQFCKPLLTSNSEVVWVEPLSLPKDNWATTWQYNQYVLTDHSQHRLASLF